MTTFTLLLFLVNAPGMATIPGFADAEVCAAAGRRIEASKNTRSRNAVEFQCIMVRGPAQPSVGTGAGGSTISPPAR